MPMTRVATKGGIIDGVLIVPSADIQTAPTYPPVRRFEFGRPTRGRRGVKGVASADAEGVRFVLDRF